MLEAGIGLAPSREQAAFLIQGSISLRLAASEKRLGPDRLTYNAYASWRMTRASSQRTVLARETHVAAAGMGKVESAANALRALAVKLAAEAVQVLRDELRLK